MFLVSRKHTEMSPLGKIILNTREITFSSCSIQRVWATILQAAHFFRPTDFCWKRKKEGEHDQFGVMDGKTTTDLNDKNKEEKWYVYNHYLFQDPQYLELNEFGINTIWGSNAISDHWGSVLYFRIHRHGFSYECFVSVSHTSHYFKTSQRLVTH